MSRVAVLYAGTFYEGEINAVRRYTVATDSGGQVRLKILRLI